MARDVRKLQKRKEKKNKREKEKRLAHRKTVNASPFSMLDDAGDFVSCEINADAFEAGIGNLLVARELPDRQVLYAIFLVDLFCLGIKNTSWGVLSRYELSHLRREMQENAIYEQLTPADAKKLVADAVAYAMRFELHPHKDCARLQRIFAGIDVSESYREFTFGNEGKPFYVPGPNDSVAFQRRVLNTLEQSAGPGNFNVMMANHLDDMDDYFDPWDDGEIIDAVDPDTPRSVVDG